MVVIPLFIEIIGGVLTSIPSEKLMFDIDFRLLVYSIIEFISVFMFLYFLDKKLLIPEATDYKYYILAIVLAIIYVFMQSCLSTFYDFIFNTSYNNKYETGFEAQIHVNLLISTVILVPITEELFFRKFIQRGLQNHISGHIAILISSFLFTIVHLSDFHNMYLLFFGGLISAILYYKSNSMIPSILFHASWNFLIMIKVY